MSKKECYSCGVELKEDELVDLGVSSSCKDCLRAGDDWEKVDINIDSHALEHLVDESIKNNVTVNMVFVKILRMFINDNKNLTEEQLSEKFKKDGASIDTKDAT